MEDRWLDDDDYGQKEYETLQNANFSMLDQEREEYDNFGNDYDTGFEIQYENERMELENDVMEYENNMMEFDKDETDAHQNRNLEFLPVLDDDFIWRTGPVIKSFTKDVYNQIVENCFSTTKKDDFSLPKFSEPGSKFAKFFVENGNVEDGLVWWKKAKEGRTRPRAREVSFNGTKVRYYSANSPILDEFKKYTIYPEGSEYYFVLYTSTHSNVDYTSLKIDKKNNISDSALKEVYGALDNRTVNSAYDFLKRNNVNVTKRQIRNQVRNQPRAVRSNRGRMCVTTPELLAELAFQKDISMFTTGNWFGLVYIDMDLIRCFVKGLPSSEDVKDYRKGLSGCSSWDQQKLNDFVESYRKETNSGIVNRMAGQLQLDSTFDLCDLVVTVLSGDFSSYRTVSSGKIRHSVLGFMLSTSKCADVHQKFADEIDKAFLKIDPRTKKTMPSFVVDEEDSFKVYSNLKYLERTQKLRCLIHRRQNFQDASKSNKLDRKTVDAVFGNKWRGLGWMSECSQQDSIKTGISGLNCDSIRRKWLLDRIDDLFETHSIPSRINGGLLLNYVTTNRIECLNSRIKLDFGPKTNGKKCTEKLIEFMSNEKTEYCNVILFNNSSTVSYVKYKQISNTSAHARAARLLEEGFHDFSVPFTLEVPRNIWKSVQNGLSLKNVFTKKVYFHSDDEAAVENDDGYTKINVTDATCLSKKCAKNASVVCIHLISVGAHLSQGKVQKFYYQLERNISELSRKAITKARNDGRVSRRFSGRKYNAFSHDNTSRTIRRFVSARDSSPIKQNSVLARRSMSLSPIPFSPSPECSVDLSKNTTGLDLSAAMNVSSDSKSNANVTQEDYENMSANSCSSSWILSDERPRRERKQKRRYSPSTCSRSANSSIN